MAWTAQTGLVPGTVSLSLKMFIVVMCYAHARLGLCTAQRPMLPHLLQSFLPEIKKHFCNVGNVTCGDIYDNNCANQLKQLCEQICNPTCPYNCRNSSQDPIPPCCNGNQNRLCGYSDAVVCQDDRGTCVYRSDPQSTFCICANQRMSCTGCEPPVSTDPSTRIPTEAETPRNNITAQHTTAKAATAQATTAQVTTVQATTVQATTAQVTTVQATTVQYTTARTTAAQFTVVQGTTAQGKTTHVVTNNQPINNGTNVAAIVLGSLFALLLLLVIIVAVMLYLRRQGRLPSFMKRTANPAELSSVSLEARNATKSKLSEPPVPGSSMEYSYAYDHRPAKTGAKEGSDQDDHTYYSVGEGGYREGNHRYVLEGQRKIIATKELDTSTDDAQDHAYLVLNRNDEADEVGMENEGGDANKVEVTDSTTGFKSKETNDEDYTPLVPTGNSKTLSEQSGKEVAVSPTSANEGDVTSPIELLTEGLSNGDDGTYFPLIQTAAPKSPVKQSGYEDAKIPTSESHDTTSPTEAQTASCDDDTYTPLVQTADSKSPKEHYGYEAAIISNPGLAADGDDTSPYEHLDRKLENKSKEGGLLATDDDYQHLGIN